MANNQATTTEEGSESSGPSVFDAELRECSESLVDNLKNKNFNHASKIISNMVESRDQKIFKAVGHLTRALHEAILNFHVDDLGETDHFKNNPHIVDNFEIQDASARLNYVISLTKNAADKTMDMVESSAPIAVELGGEAKIIKDEWQRLQRREITKDEFSELYKRIDIFLDDMCKGSEKISSNMQTILVEQGFQDLTGQVLNKVIVLVKDVEAELVKLVLMAGKVEEVTGITSLGKLKTKKKSPSSGEGPQIHAKTRDDVVANQDDVDDLLSSLGF